VLLGAGVASRWACAPHAVRTGKRQASCGRNVTGAVSTPAARRRAAVRSPDPAPAKRSGGGRCRKRPDCRAGRRPAFPAESRRTKRACRAAGPRLGRPCAPAAGPTRPGENRIFLRNAAGDQDHIELRDQMPKEVLNLRLHVPQVEALRPGVAGEHQRGPQRVIVAPPNLVRRHRRFDFDQSSPVATTAIFGMRATVSAPPPQAAATAISRPVRRVPAGTTTEPARWSLPRRCTAWPGGDSLPPSAAWRPRPARCPRRGLRSRRPPAAPPRS